MMPLALKKPRPPSTKTLPGPACRGSTETSTGPAPGAAIVVVVELVVVVVELVVVVVELEVVVVLGEVLVGVLVVLEVAVSGGRRAASGTRERPPAPTARSIPTARTAAIANTPAVRLARLQNAPANSRLADTL